MAFAGDNIFARLSHRLDILSILRRSSYRNNTSYLFKPSCRDQWFSSSADSASNEFAGENAYDLLGISETSSFEEIKASFRKVAKETHPDLAQSKNDPSVSQRFVRILAAYEILSDADKRAHYDMHLSCQRKLVEKNSRQGSTLFRYSRTRTINKQMEVVEWLKWYRFTINDIVSKKNLIVGTGYFDVLQGEFYSAVNAAYYGPVIQSMDLLPDCFEAEERSVSEVPEVLHLVSGRDLFGMVCLGNKPAELSHTFNEKLTSFANSDVVDGAEGSSIESENKKYVTSDAYKDLELHLNGSVVAVASRVPPKSCIASMQSDDCQDHIHVSLCSVGSRIPLGTITGLGTIPDEGSCFVYNSKGAKTHVIMKHRTLLVKHMHWYPVGDEISICECRCSRARLPPSKFWLFEPRCGMHDIGGWYVETFGKDKKGRTVPSRRYWDGFEPSEPPDKRLHPAMYLLALGYRTLDLEDAKRRKQGRLLNLFSWCKFLLRKDTVKGF